MRLFPILAAILVTGLIYVFVFERDRLTGDPSDSEQPQAAQDNVPTVGDGDDSATVIGVIAVRSTARTIDSAVILRGQTEAYREVDLRAETSGQVISEPLRKGNFVDEGQVLCKLDPGTREAALTEAKSRLTAARASVPEARARVEEARSRLEEAQINENAAARLSEDGFASQTRLASTRATLRSAEAAVETARSGLEGANAQIEAAQAAVASAQKEIERLTMTAPFAGLLESDTAELGSLLQPGALCATVIQLDPVILVGFVPETEVDRIKLGAPAQAELASGGTVSGKVTFLSRQADQATRTFRVEIRAANPDLSLRDGQTVEIVISADGTPAHLLPQSALTLNDEGTLGVRLVTKDNEAAFTAVNLMRDTTSGVWLTGLPDQADVIVIGQEYVNDGVKVNPSFRELGQ
ncbi:efflux RND transporter periplasmic adaptor subunit [Roseovarius sp. EGI FJ00037]|uniref:efflux RND transporter periplasmic adaptor subunit n=1 Tax=Roseovarius TaxID=74030 RepID=UPI0022A673B3|nr:efflux RND transporter periplasmic adaptor subunit [Roseovarius sp. EGI FJ00037]MCZ0810645.1 efflux RND transporter periplasmic adaptor subunit [Roseovarius sp. EGI FJ00037]